MKPGILLRRLAWIGVLLVGWTGAAVADRTPEQSELIALSDAWIAAEVGHDEAALERILDERFLSTFASSGRTVARSAYIAWILGNEIEPFTVETEAVEIHGDTALVISTAGSTKFTWIAVRKQGRWVVVSQTFSRIAEAR